MEFGTATLDPISEHRLWCPYYLSSYQFEDVEGLVEGLPAWEFVQRWLLSSFNEEVSAQDTRSSLMNDNLKKARKLMGF